MPILATPRAGREKGRQALALVMRNLQYKKAVEIGTRRGDSAVIWCGAIPELKLVCIDPWKDRTEEYEKTTERLSDYNVHVIRLASMDVVRGFANGSVDFVYIDGNHEFDCCCADIIYWSQKVRPGGLVLVHDYCVSRRSGVMRAVDAYTEAHRILPWYVTRDYEPTAFWERGIEKA